MQIYFALVLLTMTFIACDGLDDRVSIYELEAYIRNDRDATLSRIKTLFKTIPLPCDEIKKEADEFRERAEHQIGELHTSPPRDSGPLATPETAARANATQLYLDYSEAMSYLYETCTFTGLKDSSTPQPGD